MNNRLNGRLKQSVCLWSSGMELEALCRFLAPLGVPAIDLLEPEQLATVRAHGLKCSLLAGIGAGFGINRGFNDPAHREGYLSFLRDRVDAAAAGGCKQVICFSGDRRPGLSDEQGLDNCVPGLIAISQYARTKGVSITMELLNSRVDHPGYMCDRSAWGLELCSKVARGLGLDPDRAGAKEANFGLLFDLYHMQIMEGDLIRSVLRHGRWFNHYHSGGNPGRGPIDATQEINYPPLARAVLAAIEASGQDEVYLAHEFLGGGETALRQALELCDV